MSSTKVIWTIRELTESFRERQNNQFDCNIAVSGLRGVGKSTFLWKIFNSFKKEGFNAKKHQVYTRDDVVELLSNQKRGFIWDDEAINSGYKLDWQNRGQQELIKIVTNYRDNYNIYGSSLPFLYNLAKGLRELIFAHFHIIERGVAVMFLPLENQIFGQDPWDTKANTKIEEIENKRIARNPKLKFRWTRFTTFAGYVYFGDMTEKQRRQYEAIKHEKRAKAFDGDNELKPKTFKEKVFTMLIEGKLDQKGLISACMIDGQKYSNIVLQLNTMLKDGNYGKTVSDYLVKPKKSVEISEGEKEIQSLVPEV